MNDQSLCGLLNWIQLLIQQKREVDKSTCHKKELYAILLKTMRRFIFVLLKQFFIG
jgi:hypothetical protein